MADSTPLQQCALGCVAPVPPELDSERLCLSHFILRVEGACAAMRRETAAGTTNPARQSEIANYIRQRAIMLSSVATSSLRLSDDMRKRVLSTLDTLMVLRENLDRAAGRGAQLKAGGPRRTAALSQIA